MIAPSKSYSITCLSRTLGPLTHMAGTAGNEQVILREPIVYRGGLRNVPCLSGNAIRHRMVRAPLARHLVDLWGLGGRLSLAQLQWLFHGGALTEKGGRVSLADQQDLYRLFPAIALLGCSLPGQIVPGSLYVWRGVLVCRENGERLRRMLPADLAGELPRDESLRAAGEMIGRFQYTRNVAEKSATDVAAAEGEPGEVDSGMMIYSGQCVISGALFVHGFLLRHASALELGALWTALALWRDHMGTLGGTTRAGHGRLDLSARVEGGADVEAAMTAYSDHAAASRDEGLEFLDRVFRRAADAGGGDDDG